MEDESMNTRQSIKPSLLFIPALEDRFWLKLLELASRVGGFIIDLEDSIHPSAKDKARDKVLTNRAILKALRERNPHIQILVRVNNANSGHYNADIEMLKELVEERLITGVMYPKPSAPEEIDELRNDLNLVEKQVLIFPVIETLSGYTSYDKILSPEKGARWTAVGAEDICADMGIERPMVFYDNPILSRIATDIAIHAKRTGIKLWGNIWPYLPSVELLPFFVEEILKDYMIGAIGKVVFHPYQIDIVNGIFNPEVQREMNKRTMIGRLSAIAERSSKEGLTVALFNGRMVDMPELVKLQRWLREISDNETSEDIIKRIPQELRPLFGDA
jgi:citrate lyase beta subunit